MLNEINEIRQELNKRDEEIRRIYNNSSDKIRQRLNQLEEEINNSQDFELNRQIRKLICCYRNDFKWEISHWKKYIENNISCEGYDKTMKSHPDYIICTYMETGLACSRDISTGVNYNPNLREKMTKLINKYGKKRVMKEVCREAKKVNILGE